ncbi:MAG: hypothetical protein K1X70_12000 [Leptospirales bacterium]|nr:hypothetical protein [Leptospirales bacterium]HMW58104.1 hypothetical protein [Leptospiraceae bacterium]HNJ33987.1 hypothetical protein [Leptospiraceae bacterium]HNN60698.1 hypothetical protein [Leptospiraceae bacterium]
MGSQDHHEGHRFLEAIAESHAASVGVNLSEKHNHAVFRKVQSLSTPQAARSGAYFTVGPIAFDGIGQIPRKELAAVLKNLTRDRLVVQVLRFEFENGAIVFKPCFLARPQDRPESMRQIYEEIISQSATAFEKWMIQSPVTAVQLAREMQVDLSAGKEFSFNSLTSFLSLDTFVNVRLFDVLPDSEMIEAVLGDIRTSLLERNLCVYVAGYGILKLAGANAADLFDAASDFMIDRVAPRYRNRGNCRRELAQIAVEEGIYHIDEFVPETPDFLVCRAEELRRVGPGDPPESPNGRYAGAMAVEIVVALAPTVKEKYLADWRAENERSIENIKKKLTGVNAAWLDLMSFTDQKDLMKMNPANWNRLVGDESLLYGAWELPRTTMHILVHRKSSVFRRIVRGMVDSVAPREWQVLALKDLIETYEDYFKDLFLDREFVQMYGQLLRRAYLPYMNWFFRLLVALNIKLFQDVAFQGAKKRIARHQAVLEARNHERYLELMKQREEERFKKTNQIKRMALSNRMIDRLDYYYFQEGSLPTVGRLRAELGNISEEDFEALLKEERFQVITMNRGDSRDDRLLLYPLDGGWKAKSARLAEALDAQEKEYDRPDADEFQKKVLTSIRGLSRVVKKSPSIRLPESGMDPYERLEKEIRLYKERRRSSPEELEV